MDTMLLTSDGSTITGILDIAGQVVTSVITWMGQYLSFVTQNPILFLGVILCFVGIGVGMLGRLFHLT